MSDLYEYQPGTAWLAVASGRGVLTPDPDLAARLWTLVARGAGLADLLQAALLDGFAHLPDLILFELDAQALRVIVRGKFTVSVQLAGGSTATCDGQDVRTWNEQAFDRPVLVTAGEPFSNVLPLIGGVVPASGFRWSAGGGTQADAERAMPAVSMAPIARVEPAAPIALIPPSVSASPGRTSLPDTRIEPIDDSFEHLFESTVMRSVEDAAVRAPDEESPAPAGPPPTGREPVTEVPTRPGDHDGSTIMAAELAALIGATADPLPANAYVTASAIAPATADPMPPAAANARPPVLQLSTGQSVPLDRSVIIGRRPQVDRVSGNDLPHLVTVPSPQQDISRSHVAVRPGVGGWVAVDLGSTNGSIIRRAAGGSALLANGAILDLQPGDTIELGDGVTAVLLAST